MPADRRADYFLQVATVRPSAVPPLDGVAAVVVAGSPMLDAATGDAIAAHVRGGGGLVVFPDGPVTGPLAALLPAAVGPIMGDAAHPLSLSAGPYDHPIAAVWNDRANGSPSAAHVFRAAALSPADGARVVLRFADGQPFAFERPVGRGRSVVFAVAADTAASDLPDRGGLFVPLLYRCLASIVTRGEESLNVAVGQPLVGPAAVTDVGRPVTVVAPGGRGDTTVTAAGDGGGGFRYDATDRAGAYAVTVGGGGRPTVFAAAADPAESKLDPLTPADRAALSAVATVTDGVSTATPTPVRASSGLLALPLALAALALAAAEPFLSNAASRPR